MRLPKSVGRLAPIPSSAYRSGPSLWRAARLLHSLPATAPSPLQRQLRIHLAHLAQDIEQLAEAESLLDASRACDASDVEPEERRLLLMTSALVAAKRGRLAQADELVDESDALQSARHLRFDVESAQIAMEKARLLGDWHGLLKMSEEALYAAARSGVTSRIVDAGRAVASAAWYCNDDARLTTAKQMLEDCGDVEARAFARCVETALARGPIDAPARTVQTARWHAALTTTDVDLAKELSMRPLRESMPLRTDSCELRSEYARRSCCPRNAGGSSKRASSPRKSNLHRFRHRSSC